MPAPQRTLNTAHAKGPQAQPCHRPALSKKQLTAQRRRIRHRRHRRRLVSLLFVGTLAIVFCVFVGKHELAQLPFAPPPVAAATLSVNPVLQKPELPNGCEITSLATLLHYAGYTISAPDLALNYLPTKGFTYSGIYRYGPDPQQAYAGDPTSATNGWYCFEEPIVAAANAFLADAQSDLHANNITGASLSDLEKQLSKGRPVAVWFTQDYAQPRYHPSFTWLLPSGENYTPYANLHCLVLAGVNDDTCTLADPLAGTTTIALTDFEEIYTAMGSRAVVLE